MMWRRIRSGPIVTIGFGRNSVISLSRVPRPPHRMKTGISAIFNAVPPSHRPSPPPPSAAGFVKKPPTPQGWRPTVSVVVNSDQMDAELSPAATGSLRRTARYAPTAAIGKVPTVGDKEASPYAKPD